jgi:hypothetical protein
MSKLMIILGIIVAAAGAVIGALIYVSPGQMQVLGLTPEVAAVLLVGGLGLIGLGGVIGAMDKTTAATRDLRAWLSGQDVGQVSAATGATAATTVTDFAEVTASPPPFPMPTPEPPTSVSKIDALIQESKAETTRAVTESRETIAAMDKAKDELKEVLGVSEPEPPPPAVEEPPPVEEAEAEDTQLFVVEERLIRGRPARVLSDGTVEAETDDGWMRFENLEHLEEYLDAMSPGQA